MAPLNSVGAWHTWWRICFFELCKKIFSSPVQRPWRRLKAWCEEKEGKQETLKRHKLVWFRFTTAEQCETDSAYLVAYIFLWALQLYYSYPSSEGLYSPLKARCEEREDMGCYFSLLQAAYLSRYLNLSYFITGANINAYQCLVVNLKDSNGKKSIRPLRQNLACMLIPIGNGKYIRQLY